MKLKKLLVIPACLIIVVALAGIAKANWEIEGTKLSSSESIAVSAGTNFDMAFHVFSTDFTITATGMTCSGTCTVDQNGVVDVINGSVSFTGVTLDKPTQCTVPTTLTTLPLKGEVIMDPGGGTATFAKFAPKSGEKILEFEMSGASCPFAEVPFTMTGTFAGRMNNTAVSAVTQPITFNAAEETTGGGSLKMNKESATITGVMNLKLSGTNAGKSWSAG